MRGAGLARGRWIILTAVLCALAVLAAAGVVAWTKHRSTTDANQLVALGDSFSSGEGDGDYGWNSVSANPHNACHRSSHAYGALLAQQQGGQAFDFDACSGAVTQDFFASNTNGNLSSPGRPEQAQARDVSTNTKTITLTISGNDTGFSEVIRACIYDRLHLFHSPGCATDADLTSAVNTRLAALGGQGAAMTPPAANGGAGRPIHAVKDVLTELHQRAPHAQIYLANYPQLFGDFDSRCDVGTVDITTGGHAIRYPVFVSDDDARWVNDVDRRLSDVLQSQADQARAAGVPVTFVDVRPQWKGHGFCDSGDAWLLPVTGIFNVVTRQSSINASSLHPNREGQEKGYLTAFKAAGAGR